MVIIDADTCTVAQRKTQLDAARRSQGVPVRSPEEAVVLAIPKRNLETWFVYLSGEPWNEQADEWKRKKDDLAKRAANLVYHMCYHQQRLRQPAPPSLEDACGEWRRFG